MNFSPKTTLVQTQTLSQTQLQSLKILSLDNFELNNFLQNEYIENPLLDYNEVAVCVNIIIIICFA